MFTSATDQVTDLTEVTFIEDNRATTATDEVIFQTAIGETYYIAVGGEGTASGNYNLNVNLVEAVRNNNFASAYDMGTIPELTLNSLNIAADNEANEPAIIDLPNASHSVWYEWEPLATGTYQLNATATGVAFDPVLAVFDDAASIDQLNQPIATDDDSGAGTNSQLTFNAIAGRTYKIMVAGKSAEEKGTFDLVIEKLTDTPDQTFFPITIRPNITDAQDTNTIVFSGLPAGSQLVASDFTTVRSTDIGGGRYMPLMWIMLHDSFLIFEWLRKYNSELSQPLGDQQSLVVQQLMEQRLIIALVIGHLCMQGQH